MSSPGLFPAPVVGPCYFDPLEVLGCICTQCSQPERSVREKPQTPDGVGGRVPCGRLEVKLAADAQVTFVGLDAECKDPKMFFVNRFVSPSEPGRAGAGVCFFSLLQLPWSVASRRAKKSHLSALVPVDLSPRYFCRPTRKGMMYHTQT